MITGQQLERCVEEFTIAARQAFEKAKCAEHILEDYTYSSTRTYDPDRRAQLLKAYNDADYEAESRALIRELLKKVLKDMEVAV